PERRRRPLHCPPRHHRHPPTLVLRAPLRGGSGGARPPPSLLGPLPIVPPTGRRRRPAPTRPQPHLGDRRPARSGPLPHARHTPHLQRRAPFHTPARPPTRRRHRVGPGRPSGHDRPRNRPPPEGRNHMTELAAW